MNQRFSKGLLIGILALAIVVGNNAYAKKMGGGNSIGRQSGTVAKNQNSLPPKPTAAPVNSNPSSTAKPAAPATPTPVPAQQPSRFGGLGGILGGVAAGIGLSYLFSHMGLGGIGEGIASALSGILLIAAIGFLIMFLVRRFGSTSGSMLQPASVGTSRNANAQYNYDSAWNNSSSSVNKEPLVRDIPQNSSTLTKTEPTLVINDQKQVANQSEITPTNWSDKDSFLQNAKSLFLQLQEASDQQNLEKLREYTTPELFDLLRQDMLSRVTAFSFTQVLTLAADLVAVEENAGEFLASTRFSGTIREEKDGPITEFEEVWNWVKPIQGNVGWLLCGIQQIH